MNNTMIRTVNLLALTATTAQAVDRTVTLVPDVLDSSNNAKVIVWRDAKSMKEGNQLLEEGINKTKPELLMPLVSCLVDRGTKARTSGWTMFSATQEVLVVTGPAAGCRGIVERRNVDASRESNQ